jgi:isocitrate lyase
VQQVKAGLQAIYLSGWQVAADANLSGHTYPDQSLYPANSVPAVVRRINNAMMRVDQIAWANGENRDRPGELIVPIVADAEAGFGGPLNAFELMKQMIMAGRRRRALGRSARCGEEVRASWRQGAHSDPAACSDPQRRSARGRTSWAPRP